MRQLLRTIQSSRPASQRRAKAIHRNGEVDTVKLMQLLQELNQQNRKSQKEVQAARGQIQDLTGILQSLQSQLELARKDNLQLRKLSRGRKNAAPCNVDLTPIDPDYSLERCFERLDAIAPRAYKIWKELLQVNADTYVDFPPHSCSVKGHGIAEFFSEYLEIYLEGTVLDIGCGPQPVPAYLASHPVELIAGLDPLAPPIPHPFAFAQGVAEYLPWKDDTFDVVVAATSLDHVLLLDQAYLEIQRVLKSNGYFVVWVGFVKGAVPYDPYSEDIDRIDDFHLFHFDRPFFYELHRKYFDLVDELHVDGESLFACFRPKLASTTSE